ncbi:MAG: pilus assembly protein PilM [Deltaproteobacteria bacterium]|nr:pilus assembly protein PilM [Deltaproteobacteria bacterium]MBW2307062.1 pilus assembly protein PilM [Deltaproteobacteria bacterium]
MIVLRSSVGIDFQEKGLAIVHLQRTLQGTLVRHSLFQTFPSDAGPERIEEMAALEIQNFFRRNRISTDRVRVGIPRREAMVRLIALPEAARENLGQVMQYEVDRYLPFRPDDLCFDHHYMGSGRRPKTIRVMLVAVRKDTAERYLQILQKARVQPTAVEISSTALTNAFAFSKSNEGEPLILVEMGRMGFEVNVVSDQNLIFSRFTAYPADGISGFIRGELDRLLAQLEEEMQRPITQPVSVIFSGKEASEQIIQDLEGKGEFNCMLASPPARFASSEGRVEKPFQLAVAVGLARCDLYRTPIRIDLLPRSKKLRPSRMGKRLTKALIVLLVITGLLWQGGRLVRQRLELQRIRNNIEQLKPAAEATVLLRQKVERIKHQIEVLINEVNQRPGTLVVLRELSRIIPPTAWFSNLNYEGEKLVISGYAQSASGLISVLEASPLLEKVEFSAPINVDPRMERERFQIEAEMKP